MKICTKCKNEKPESEFFFKSKSKNILHSQCKECKREIDRKSYRENSNGRKEKIRNNAIKKYNDLKKILIDYKKQLKCEKCKDDRWYVLDFHHIGDKDYEISDLLRFGSKKLLINELKKCIPLCSNCHREVHYFERLKSLNLLNTTIETFDDKI